MKKAGQTVKATLCLLLKKETRHGDRWVTQKLVREERELRDREVVSVSSIEGWRKASPEDR